ncbi:hypothetical protein RNS40_09780 [Staphylococcus pseudintermedius]|uniref:hypothetical protein n=1 Tax=Staphylococcus pseudintermedius TaxID=283734 RepID=UPI002886DAE7|nr:hypothetical protein [Staphylococcus pseudintermedius]MDT0942885.1 hypothetical protein [Staphylococcus pseudintermedius]
MNRERNTYEITKGFDSRILIKGMITLKSLLLWCAIVAIGLQITKIFGIEGYLKSIIIVFHGVMGIILLTTRPSHPDRPTYKVIGHILIGKDDNKYSSIDINQYR